jgi:CBS domain-containing protein/anti-sigma regulatory factor (Ser/Thr protein kinase)
MAEMARSDITILQELVYELKIEQVMTKTLITVRPDDTMADLKRLLQENRISGAPVCGDDEKLVGIVSIEDLIKSLEQGEQSAQISEKMTCDVYTVYVDESVVAAVNKFGHLGVGRLPVIDREGNLKGILTQGDIVSGLLRQLQMEHQEEELRRYRASHIFEDIVSDQTGLILRYRVAPKDFIHGGEASSNLKRALARLGGAPQLVRKVAIATYEAEMNVIIHSDEGGEVIAEIMPDRIRIIATDTGPGIPDVEKAMEPGFSTAPDWIRELGFGAGMGLNNIQACADRVRLTSTMGVGTRLEIYFDLDAATEAQ